MAGIPNPQGQLAPPNLPPIVPGGNLGRPQAQPGNLGQLPIAPAAAAGPLPVTNPRTFQEFFADSTKDPCTGNYNRVMQRFEPENPNAAAQEVLFNQAVNGSSNMHEAYLCCASTHHGPRIYCIHSPS
jgi:hypothetical protein